MALAEPRDAGQLAIFFNESFGLARNLFGRNLNFDLAFRIAYSFGWAHVLPFVVRLILARTSHVVYRQSCVARRPSNAQPLTLGSTTGIFPARPTTRDARRSCPHCPGA